MARSKGSTFCDELWSLIVKSRDNHCCIVCGDTNMINAHHLISRKIFAYRWKSINGVTLCPKHHKFDLLLSAHTSPWGLDEWMQENRVEAYKQWCINRKSITSYTADYDILYHELEMEYKNLTGSFHKINRIQDYLLSLQFNDIQKDFLENPSIAKLSEKYLVSKNVMINFLKLNKLLKK